MCIRDRYQRRVHGDFIFMEAKYEEVKLKPGEAKNHIQPNPSFWCYLSPETTRGFMITLAYRIFLSLYVRSDLAPDEYWQSVEISHKMVYGVGYETWEWTIPTPIRSTLHPFLYATCFKILQVFSLDYSCLIAYLSLIHI
eukprot:TRINITY_DN9036_c0_g1_i1.p1 TRINITY_DN9036_c0_g1~~TRINITY_DN9036_c0_g1_i1.p1  ORF type:complete len:140 (+),score=35.30 TRINITY_DN9036_c0_g1_i1:63-482(+)